MRLFPYIAGISALFCGFAAPTLADTTQFKIEHLRVPGRVLGVQAEDCNSDGKRDLFVVFATGRPPAVQRKIAVWFDHGNTFSADPDQIVDPPRSAAFVDLGDVDGDGKRALLFGDARGMSALRLGADSRFETTPRPLVKAFGLFALPGNDDLP